MLSRSLIPRWALVCASVLTLAAASHAASSTKVDVNRNTVRVVIHFPTVEMVPSGDREEPAVGSLPRLAIAPGHPRLPVASRTILLPEGMRVSHVRVRGSSHELPGRHDLAWGQPPRRLSDPGGEWVQPDPGVFASSRWYPARPARISGEGRLHGFRIATIRLWPVQVRPSLGTVRSWESLEVSVELVPDREGRKDPFAPGMVLRRDLRDLVATTENPETVFGYAERSADEARESEQPYLVITTETLQPAFQRLIEHRRAHGLAGEILTMESIEANHEGRDPAEKLRNAIRDAYQSRGTRFVLLGGDDADDGGNPLIPIRQCQPSDNTPSDYYF